MSASHSGIERRQFGRRPTYMHGWVKLPGRPPVTCVIRNISEGGALLAFDTQQTLPFEFLLDIEGFDLTVGCEVRHHYGDRVGVAFIETDLVKQNATANHSAVACWVKSKFEQV